jgi:hypothetical protein
MPYGFATFTQSLRYNHDFIIYPLSIVTPVYIKGLSERVTIIYHSFRLRKYPAVAQPGRAFGCRSWLFSGLEADRVNSLSGVHCAVTEESQAQTKLKKCCFGANPARGISSYDLLQHVSKVVCKIQ